MTQRNKPGPNVAAVVAAVKAGRIVGEKAIALMAEAAVQADAELAGGGRRAAAASAPDHGDEHAGFEHLWPARPGREAAWQAARDQADRDAGVVKAARDMTDDELHAALFGEQS